MITNTNLESDKSFLTIKELCIYLNLKESHVRRMVFLSEIPYFKMGRLIRFKLTDIDAWLEEKSINPKEAK